MCGLFSIFPKAGADPLSLRILALFLGLGNVPRGRHSFGMWGNGIEPFRALGAINDEANIATFRGFIFNAWNPEDRKWIAGHTRQATHGGRTLENCHPFTNGTLTLAHNGVVSVEGLTVKDHVVDSGQIAIAIVNDGWEAGLAKVSGSCGLVASVGDSLVLYRHSQVLHLAEGDWGWAVSSERSVLIESLALAGLAVTGKVEPIIENHVFAPWDNVSQHCPAKLYTAPATSYRGGDYENQWGKMVNGVWTSKTNKHDMRHLDHDSDDPWDDTCYGYQAPRTVPQQQSLPFSGQAKTDSEAKDKFLTPTSDIGSVTAPYMIDRATTTLIELGGVNSKGPIVLRKDSAVRKRAIQWAVEVNRIDNSIQYTTDPKTGILTGRIVALGMKVMDYRSLTDEEKETVWVAHYAKVLNNIGVTTAEFAEALTAYADTASGEQQCDWCNVMRRPDILKDCNFGTDLIKVCTYCMSDYKASRRSMDFRNIGSLKDERRKASARRR